MHPLPINRWQWEYWLDGAGSWLERWHCTGNDGLLAFMVCSGVLWMVAEYFRYAYLVNQSEELFPDPAYRAHLKKLVVVFLFCGAIHLFNIVSWVWTPYLIWATCFYVNAWASHRLNRSFAKAIKARKLIETESAKRLRDIRERLSEEHPRYELGDIEPYTASKTLVQLIEDLRKIIG